MKCNTQCSAFRKHQVWKWQLWAPSRQVKPHTRFTGTGFHAIDLSCSVLPGKQCLSCQGMFGPTDLHKQWLVITMTTQTGCFREELKESGVLQTAASLGHPESIKTNNVLALHSQTSRKPVCISFIRYWFSKCKSVSIAKGPGLRVAVTSGYFLRSGSLSHSFSLLSMHFTTVMGCCAGVWAKGYLLWPWPASPTSWSLGMNNKYPEDGANHKKTIWGLFLGSQP